MEEKDVESYINDEMANSYLDDLEAANWGVTPSDDELIELIFARMLERNPEAGGFERYLWRLLSTSYVEHLNRGVDAWWAENITGNGTGQPLGIVNAVDIALTESKTSDRKPR